MCLPLSKRRSGRLDRPSPSEPPAIPPAVRRGSTIAGASSPRARAAATVARPRSRCAGHRALPGSPGARAGSPSTRLERHLWIAPDERRRATGRCRLCRQRKRDRRSTNGQNIVISLEGGTRPPTMVPAVQFRGFFPNTNAGDSLSRFGPQRDVLCRHDQPHVQPPPETVAQRIPGVFGVDPDGQTFTSRTQPFACPPGVCPKLSRSGAHRCGSV